MGLKIIENLIKLSLNLLRVTEKYNYDLGGKTYITNNLKIDLRGIYNDEAEIGVSS